MSSWLITGVNNFLKAAYCAELRLRYFFLKIITGPLFVKQVLCTPDFNQALAMVQGFKAFL